MVFKKTSPFYIVSNNGQDIQELFEWIQNTLEKQGITPLLDVLKTLFDIAKAQISSYTLLTFFEDLLKQLLQIFSHITTILRAAPTS